MTLREIRYIIREVVSFEFEPDFERGGGPQKEPDQSGVTRHGTDQEGDTSGMLRQPGTFSEKSKESPHFWFDSGSNEIGESEDVFEEDDEFEIDSED